MLYPFWGSVPEPPSHPKRGRFDKYTRTGGRFFQITPAEEADLIIYPQEWEPGQKDAGELGRLACAYGKPLVIFFNNDSDEEINVKEGVVFRTSFYRSRRKPNEHAMPAWSEDLVERFCDGVLPLRSKGSKPVVSYCGYSGSGDWSSLKVLARRFLGRTAKKHPGQSVRSRAIALLRRAPGVKTNFIIRKDYWGGAMRPGGLDPVKAAAVRREFVQNMLDGDYVLCARGGGNFSYRLYETLSCGRIPLFIDTDCVLPYEEIIDWKQYCVWVPEGELDRIAEILAEFHERLSEEDFRDLQMACRRLWLEWICPEGFFKNFYRFFDHAPYE